jgi:hypothetical protein
MANVEGKKKFRFQNMFEGGSSKSASEREATGTERERKQKRSRRHNRSKTFEGAKLVFMGTVTENKLDEFGTKGREIFLLFVKVFFNFINPVCVQKTRVIIPTSIIIIIIIIRRAAPPMLSMCGPASIIAHMHDQLFYFFPTSLIKLKLGLHKMEDH